MSGNFSSIAASNAAVNELTSEVDSLYLEQYAFTTSAAIVGSLNKSVFVLLRDGRNLFGILRTFDQYANLVIQDTTERVYLLEEKQYGEIFQDNFLIRGENVVMFGELDLDAEDDHLKEFTKIDYKEANAKLNKKNEEKIKKGREHTKTYLQQGFTSDFSKADLY
ncbi:Lsm1 protein [Saccharomycopsis crataegensis]|uniref:U6 snRNA-associated Sm-like protein LSm1 n=1 Tax=Saccharomycopsis crataegensis TaxID=43959 RepID=A0AAV5QMT3_9ASCO|nr:Lsm1 protein [Saccharomycopsis crataegensis]